MFSSEKRKAPRQRHSRSSAAGAGRGKGIPWRGEARRLLRLELLETRRLLDAGPVYITEFMAKNSTKYENNAGNYTDWLELYNPTSAAVTLGSATAGQSYYLTNDATNLTLWAFPAGVSLAAGAYMVVNCDTTLLGGTGAYTNTVQIGTSPWVWPAGTTQYYTGFNLPASGGYVALVQPDGATIASQYDYPNQLADVSYGVLTTTSTTNLVSPGATATYLVPTSNSATSGWTTPGYNAPIPPWSSGPTSLGFGPAMSTPPTTTPTGYYAPFGPNGTWNYYEVVSTPSTWQNAYTNAASQTFGGQTGHLAVVRSAAESTFLWSLVGSQAYYIGLTNNATDFGTSGSYAKLGAYDYGAEMNDLVPASGAPAATTLSISSITYSGTGGLTANVTTTTNHGLTAGQEVVIAGATQSGYDGNFAVATVTGSKTFTYTMTSAPGVNASGTMTALVPQKGYGFVWADGESFTYDQGWASNQPNDSNNNPNYTGVNGLFVKAATSAGGWDDTSGSTTLPYVIEFNLGLASSPDAGNLSAVEVHGSSALSTIAQGISLITTPGSATVTNYTSVLASYCDPEDLATNQHFTTFPFGGDTTSADHNFAVEIQGSIQIPATGVYTFDVNSSDGFQFTIPGASFSGSSSGTTYSGNTMSYSGTRAAADSLGVVTLNAGTYPITLYYFDGATDAPRLELSAASGTQTSFNASFHLVGDTTNGGLGVVAGGTAAVGTNLQTAMQNVNPTALVRIPFSVDTPSTCTQLSLLMEYDDGFVAYLNGVPVAEANAPTVPISTITYSGTTATVTTTTALPATLTTGQEVLIAGATPLLYDGSFTVTVTGTYTFTYAMASTPTSNASGTMTVLTPLAYNATATARRGWNLAQSYQSFNLASYQSLLQGGQNVLAIQGLMYSSSDSDFLLQPEIQYSSFNINNIEYFTTPTPGAVNVPGNLGTVSNTSFTVPDGFYTAPFSTSITCPTAAATILYTLDGRSPVVPTFGGAETIGSITSVGTTAMVTTASAHGYYTGDQVRIAGASPAQYDGVFNINVLSSTTFTYTMASSFAGSATSPGTAVLIPVSTVNNRTITGITYGGTGGLTATASTASTQSITSITYSGTTATVTCPSHGYYSGQMVLIAGATPTQYDGLFPISVTGTNTFTYPMLTSPGSNASGTMTVTAGHGYSTGQLIQITGAAQWQYDGVFTIASVPSATTFTYTMSAAPSTSASGAIVAAAVSTLAYTGPIYISTTTTLRTEAIEVGYFTSRLDTASYLFMSAVVNTPQIFTDDPTNYFYSLNQQYVTNPNFNANNYPEMWTGIDSADTYPHGGSPTTEGQYQDLYSADYQMDPEVVDDPNYASTIISDMQSIPTLSLVGNPDDFFGDGISGTNGVKGIYVNANNTDANGTVNPQWKREVSVELINPDGSVGFQINASLKMHGGGSDVPDKEPEHTMTLGFSSDYDGPLNYPFFGPSGASSFVELTLRAGYNDAMTHAEESQRQYDSYLQDMYTNMVLAAEGGPVRHSTWVNLYINGIYWGLYNPSEYPDSVYASDYFGGNAADWDTVKPNESGLQGISDGDANAWNTMYVVASNGGAMLPAQSISSLAWTSTSYNSTLGAYTTTVTATTTAAHGYSSGANVYISGALPSEYDGYFIITVTGANTFTYQYSGTQVANPTGTMTVAQIAPNNANALANPAAFQLMEQYLNVPEFIEYMIDMYYTANQDYQNGVNHNWAAMRESRDNGVPTNAFGGFDFISWDGERTLEGTSDNVIGQYSTSAVGGLDSYGVEQIGPGFLFNQLKVNPEFQIMWADAVHKYMYNNGPLSPNGAAALYATDSQAIDRAIVGESARWGDYRRDIDYGVNVGIGWQGPAFLYTRNGLANSSYLLAGNTTTLYNNADDPTLPVTQLPDTWIVNQNRMFTTVAPTYNSNYSNNSDYFPVRTGNVISEFENYSPTLYPASTLAPEFSPLPTGGDLTTPLTLTDPSGVGTIYYTTDGSDPRVQNIPSPILVSGIPSSVSEILLSGANTYTVRVPNNGYANGETVQISGATPLAYDGDFVISNVTQDTFQITVNGSPAAATGTIVCQPCGISPNGTSVIVWLPGNGLIAGNKVLMSGAVQQTALNGVFTVTAATANTFTFTLPGASLDTTDTGITAQRVDAAVSSITYSGGTATVTTATPHGYSNNALVRIVGANSANFNGDFLITVTGPNTFTYTTSITAPSISSITYGGTGGTTATATTATAHGFITGEQVTIAGASPSQYDGTFIITVTGVNTFTYTMTSSPGSNASGTMTATPGVPTNGNYIGAVRVLSPTAHAYTGPITLTQTTRIRARVLNGTTWSALNDAWFINATAVASASNLAITEINYNPVGPTAAELAINPGFKGNDFQFMELQNIGSLSIDLTGVQLTLGFTPAFSFSGAAVTTLAKGAYVLIVENPQAFAARYGTQLTALYGANWQSMLVAGEFTQKLDNGGERVLLTDRAGNTIEDFTYNNGGAWPGRAAGSGSTLQIINPSDDPTDPNNWQSSLDYNGSPGAADAAAAGVVINEVVPNITSPNNGSIESYNPTSSTINIGGWNLTDSLSDLDKFTIPAGTTIAAGQYLQYNDSQYDVTPYSGNVYGVVKETTDTDNVTPVLKIEGDTVNELTERQIILPAGAIGTGSTHTILTFDFMSTTEGQVQGIGLDSGNTFSSSNSLFYRIYGTGTAGTAVTGYYSTPGVWQTYTIDLGVIAANETHLFFYVDDATATGGFAGADERFRNLSVYAQGSTVAYINFDQYFGLDGAHGGSVWLVKTDGSGNPLVFEDHESYDSAASGEAWGLWPNGSGGMYPMSSATTGAANSGPLVPAATGANTLVISEVMYDPPDLANGLDGQPLEYVKITNVSTTTAVTLTNWRLRSAVSFDFPSGQTLAAGASLLVVPFDPINNPDALTRFEARYPGFSSSQLVLDGPYSGALGNGGDTLDLEQPGTPLSSDITYTPHLIEDEVAYSNLAPWPTLAHGGGDSLQRNMATIGWGDAWTSWTAGSPTIGLLEAAPVGAADVYVYTTAPTTSITSITYSGTTAMATTAAAHGYSTGQQVQVTGATPAQYDGIFSITVTGLTTFTYTMSSSPGSSASGTMTTATYPRPTLLESAAAGVLANDTGTSLSALLVDSPAYGNVAFSANGSFTYTPKNGYQGPDSFQYQTSDGTLLSPTVTVLINPPSAAPDSYTADMNTTLSILPGAGLLHNDSDPSGYHLLADLVAPPAYGSLTLNGDGSFTYVPNAGYAGTDSFSYVANDGVVDSTVATVSITVDSVTTQPSAKAINAGQNTTFTAASSSGTDTVQWKVNSGSGFVNVTNGGVYSGATTTTLTITGAAAAMNTYQYEAVFTNTAGTLTSNAVALAVDSISTQPAAQAVNAGQNANFTAVTSGSSDTVQWQVNSGSGFVNVTNGGVYSGATTTTLTITGAAAAMNTYQYEAVFTNTAGTLTSNPATLTVNSATVAVWNSAGDATWNSAGNWSDTQGAGVPGFSGVTGDQATFNDAAELNVDLGNFSPSIAGLTFDPTASNYDIQSSGSGELHLNNGSSTATITVSAGSQTIAAPLALDSSVSIAAAAGSRLAISGPISGPGSSLTLGGGGTLVLSGANSYNGGTTVSAGTLVLSNSSAIAAYTNLTVGAGGTLIFDPSITASSDTTVASNVMSARAPRDTSVAPAAKAASPSQIVAASLPASSSPAAVVRGTTVLPTEVVASQPAPTRSAAAQRAMPRILWPSSNPASAGQQPMADAVMRQIQVLSSADHEYMVPANDSAIYPSVPASPGLTAQDAVFGASLSSFVRQPDSWGKLGPRPGVQSEISGKAVDLVLTQPWNGHDGDLAQD